MVWNRTRVCTHTHTHTHPHMYTRTPKQCQKALSWNLSPLIAHTYALTLARTRTLAHTHTHALTSHSPCWTHARTHALTDALPEGIELESALLVAHKRTHTHSLTRILAHARTRTPEHELSHTRTHSPTHCPKTLSWNPLPSSQKHSKLPGRLRQLPMICPLMHGLSVSHSFSSESNTRSVHVVQ